MLTPISNGNTDPELALLFESISKRKGETLTFEERRDSEFLTEPVVISGTLRRAEDGRLIRQIEQPSRETHILYEDRVEITRPNGHYRSFNIKKAPELQALRYALTAILSGQSQFLREQFEVNWKQKQDHWKIHLIPLKKDIGEGIEALVVRGCGDQISSIELRLDDSEIIRTNIGRPGTE